MGLSDIVREIRSERNRELGQRVFEFLKGYPSRMKPPMGPQDLVRISSLPYLCAREEVLASQHEIIRVENIPPHLRITFDIGDRFHELYRNMYFGPMGEWGGAWECKRCGWDTDAAGLSEPPELGKRPAKLARMPKECPECGAVQPSPCPMCGELMGTVCPGCFHIREGCSESTVDHLRFDDILVFKEWSIRDDKVGIKGHPDGWKMAPGSKAAISDLKSHGSNGFKTRNTARVGHPLQVWGYQHCSGERGVDGSIIYMNKSPWGDHSAFIREVKVAFNEVLFKSEVVEPIAALREGLNGGPLPDRLCIDPVCSRAKECQLRDVCFG